MRVENKHMQEFKVRELNYETEFSTPPTEKLFLCNIFILLATTITEFIILFRDHTRILWSQDFKKTREKLQLRGNWKVHFFHLICVGKIEKLSIKIFLNARERKKLLSERKISTQPKRRQREAYDVILRHFSANLKVFHMENWKILNFFPRERLKNCVREFFLEKLKRKKFLHF